MNGTTQKELPEITLKATLLAIFLTIILAAANAFLGLKVGLTISASIPAAVISMGLLRLFKEHNALENNIVQTAASAGEALTAGIIFTLPALIVIRYWYGFKYWPTVILAMMGGILGVLFSVPLRRILLADKTLAFPEGTAIGNVLKASDRDGFAINLLMKGGIIGSLISLFQSGFKFIQDVIQIWIHKGNILFGFGIGFSPALIGAGYIIGINVGLAIGAGILIGWVIGVPVLAEIYGVPAGNTAADIALALWSQHIRFIGLGVMMIGGIWAIFALIKPIIQGIKKSFDSVYTLRTQGLQAIPRVDRDIPIHFVLGLICLISLPVFGILYYLASQEALGINYFYQVGYSFINIICILTGGFILAAVCAYFAGLVGSSANPLSSIALMALILVSLVTMIVLHNVISFNEHSLQALSASAIVICVTALMAATASISNDTIQDLKAGQMVGATPWKQQVMLILGVIVASFIIPLILQLLFDAYGMAGVFPRPGMDPQQMLLAPQAGMMATVVNSMFLHTVNPAMLITGFIIAFICLIIDKLISKKGYRLPLLAVGLGIYLPIDTTTPLMIGGILSWLSGYFVRRRAKSLVESHKKQYAEDSHQRGLLVASGLVAGSAIMGVILAIPFAWSGSTDALRLISPEYFWFPIIAAIIVLITLCIWIIRSIISLKAY